MKREETIRARRSRFISFTRAVERPVCLAESLQSFQPLLGLVERSFMMAHLEKILCVPFIQEHRKSVAGLFVVVKAL